MAPEMIPIDGEEKKRVVSSFPRGGNPQYTALPHGPRFVVLLFRLRC